jgi:peptide/nickel transport system substrate-binding protein
MWKHSCTITTLKRSPILCRAYSHCISITNGDHTLKAAQDILEADGWEKGEDGVYVKGKNKDRLAFTITTASTPELKHTAEVLERTYDALGADVSVEVFDLGSLHQDVIRPRSYDALLFGQVVGRSGDLYPFWHSSQRNDPGLNISLYTNITVDDILADIRTTLDADERKELYASLESEIRDEHPAVFLYAPHLLYLVPATTIFNHRNICYTGFR